MLILTHDENGKTYYFNGRDDSTSDVPVVRETWSENVYQIFRRDLRDNGIFVDLGANIGAVSVYAASLNDGLDPEVMVYAVEPEPNNLKLLEENVIQNNVQSFVRICPVAISDRNGFSYITDSHGHSQVNDAGDGAEVGTLRLAEFLRTHNLVYVDVLKVDVEGMEYDIIADCDMDTLRKIRYLTLEFDAAPDEIFGPMVAKLSKVFQIHILGSPERGGYIYARRYD